MFRFVIIDTTREMGKKYCYRSRKEVGKVRPGNEFSFRVGMVFRVDVKTVKFGLPRLSVDDGSDIKLTLKDLQSWSVNYYKIDLKRGTRFIYSLRLNHPGTSKSSQETQRVT